MSVNGTSVMGKSYGQVVQLIKVTQVDLYLVVVPQQDDILQTVSKKWEKLPFSDGIHNRRIVRILYVIAVFPCGKKTRNLVKFEEELEPQNIG